MNPQATITAVDTPNEYWYTALTSYGQQASGVRLYGTGLKFRVGEIVDVFQCGTEYGFSETSLSYKSQLSFPDAMKPEVVNKAPASVALAYIAKLAGNNQTYYIPGTVVSIIDTWYMMVTSTLSTSPLRLLCVINTSAFYVGARVLIQAYPLKTPHVIGWWNCLPEPEPEDAPEWWTDEDEAWWDAGWWGDLLHRNKTYAIAIGRPPYTADIDIILVDNDYNWIKRNVFYHRNPASNIAFATVYATTDAEDYYYVKAMMGINYGAILERYWLKVHKQTFTFYEMTEAEFPPNPGTPYSYTANSLSWILATTCNVSDGIRTFVAFNPGPTLDSWLPLQGWHYNTNDFRS